LADRRLHLSCGCRFSLFFRRRNVCLGSRKTPDNTAIVFTWLKLVSSDLLLWRFSWNL